MDDVDRAQDQEDMFRRRAISAAAGKTRATTSAFHCIDCENTISEARRIAAPGCERCVFCEKENETLRRR